MGNKANRYTNVARFYDYDASERMNKDIPFYLDYAKKAGARFVLDLCCGTGRVAIPFAKEGYHVTAIDQSEAMLSVFKTKLANVPSDAAKRIKIIEGDATDFSVERKYELVVIPYRSFQQFAHEIDAIHCLRCVREHLAPNGLFIISVVRPLKTLDQAWVYPKTKQWQIVENGKTITKYHWGERIEVDRALIHPVLCYEVEQGEDKEVFYEDLTLKFYYYDKIVNMIKSSGFDIVEEYGDYERAPIDSGTEMIFVCRGKDE